MSSTLRRVRTPMHSNVLFSVSSEKYGTMVTSSSSAKNSSCSSTHTDRQTAHSTQPAICSWWMQVQLRGSCSQEGVEQPIFLPPRRDKVLYPIDAGRVHALSG